MSAKASLTTYSSCSKPTKIDSAALLFDKIIGSNPRPANSFESMELEIEDVSSAALAAKRSSPRKKTEFSPPLSPQIDRSVRSNRLKTSQVKRDENWLSSAATLSAPPRSIRHGPANGLDDEKDSDEEEDDHSDEEGMETPLNRTFEGESDSQPILESQSSSCSQQSLVRGFANRVLVQSPSKRSAADDICDDNRSKGLSPPQGKLGGAQKKVDFASVGEDFLMDSATESSGRRQTRASAADSALASLRKSTSNTSASSAAAAPASTPPLAKSSSTETAAKVISNSAPGSAKSAAVSTSGGRKIFSSEKKRPVYHHVFGQGEKDEETAEPGSTGSPSLFAAPAATSRVSPTNIGSKTAPGGLQAAAAPAAEKPRKFFKSGGIAPAPLQREQRQPPKFFDEEYTAVRCNKEDKELFTVIRNVKQAHECLESGETQAFSDDIEYLLKDLNKSSTQMKCLSILSLASKCLSGQFRTHLKAHKYSGKIFAALADTPSVPSLAICTATVLYILARDRLGVDPDPATLALIAKLMRVDANVLSAHAQNNASARAEIAKFRERAWDVLDRWRAANQQLVGAEAKLMFDITKENLTPALLATESMVFVVLRKMADDSLKFQLRDIGCLEFVSKQLSVLTEELDPDFADWASDSFIDTLRQLQRYLKILENSTFMCPPNQIYIITLGNFTVLESCVTIIEYAQKLLAGRHAVGNVTSPDESPVTSPAAVSTRSAAAARPNVSSAAGVSQRGRGADEMSPPSLPSPTPSQSGYPSSPIVIRDDNKSALLFDLLTAAMKVLCNLSHENELCCQKLGQSSGFLPTCLATVVTLPHCLPTAKRFDLIVLGLGLLINSCERSNANRRAIVNMKVKFFKDGQAVEVSALEALIKVFLHHDQAARDMDDEIEGNERADAAADAAGEISTADLAPDEAEEEEPVPVRGARRVRKTEAQELQDVVKQALDKAGQHMEDSMAASYTALLIGCILQQNEEHVDQVKQLMPNQSIKPMVEMVTKFLEFMEMTTFAGNSGHKSMAKILEILERYDD